MDDTYLAQVKSMIKSVLVSSPDVLSLYEVNKDFKNYVGNEIPFRKLGYNSLEEFMRSLSDTVVVSGSGTTAKITPVTTKKSVHMQQLVSIQNRPKRIRCRKQLRSSSRNMHNQKQQFRVQCQQLQFAANTIKGKISGRRHESVNKLEREQLKICETNYKTTTSAADPVKRVNKNDSKQNSMPVADLNNLDKSDAIPEYAITQCILEIDFPEDAVRYGVKIEMPQLNAIVPLKIVKICTPEKFYFQILDVERFKRSILDMQDFYNSMEVPHFKMPKYCITPGQLCAAKQTGQWARAEILTTLNFRGIAEVFLIDYGNIIEVPQEDIKFLHKKFIKIPAQLVCARLSSITAIGRTWSIAATNYFKYLTENRILYGLITAVEKEKKAHIILCDTNGKKTRNINNLLLQNDYAMLCTI